MSQSNMLRALGLALSLAAGGCFAEGSAGGEVGTTEQDIQAPESADTAEPGGHGAAKAPGPAGVHRAGPDALPKCDSCGDPVPWTPPRGALKPHLTPDPDETK